MIGLITVALSIALVVPTAYWVRLRAPHLRPVVEFITLLPFVIPPVVLVFGLIQRLQPAAAAVHQLGPRQQRAPRLRLRRPCRCRTCTARWTPACGPSTSGP
ncbi:MAG: hypothetical protein WKF78_09945 [Candidatus Limnocylindrales bacterium]